jgi:hypothetical protein
MADLFFVSVLAILAVNGIVLILAITHAITRQS